MIFYFSWQLLDNEEEKSMLKRSQVNRWIIWMNQPDILVSYLLPVWLVEPRTKNLAYLNEQQAVDIYNPNHVCSVKSTSSWQYI